MMEGRKVEKSVQLVKPYNDRNKKSMTYGNILSVFPSFNFYVKGRYDIQAIIQKRSPYLSGITVPISHASKTLGAVSKLPEMEKEAFYNSVPIVVDFESDYWYHQSEGVASRRKAFCGIKDMPPECSKLFTVPKKKDEKKHFREIRNEYLNKLRTVFGSKGEGDDSVMIRMTVACMNHATENLMATIPLPVAPIILGDDASKYYCLRANEIYNKYKDIHGLFKVAYYPIHPTVLQGSPHVLREIVDQIYAIQPDLVFIGTLKSQEFLCPQNKYDQKRTYFDDLVRELSHYSKTTKSISFWYDRGDFTSSYGLKLIREGFDCMITPLKGHYGEGGYGSPNGPQYAYILNEYPYYKWEKYLNEAGEHYINNKTPDELRKMTPQQQWAYKRQIEIATRHMQFEHIHTKLETEGSLADYDIQLKRNKIE